MPLSPENNESGEPPANRLRPPRFGKTLQRSIRETWNHLGTVMVVNGAIFTIVFLPVSIADFVVRLAGIFGWIILALFEIILVAFCFGVLASFAHDLLAKEEITISSLWRQGLRRLGLSFRVLLLDLLIIVILIANVIFYLTRSTLIGGAVAFFIFDILVLALVLGYLQPAVLADAGGEPEKSSTDGNISAITILRRSALIFLLESRFVFTSFLVTALIGALLTLTVVGLPLLGYGFGVIYIACVHQEIMASYGLGPEPLDPSKPVEDDWKGISG